ncbi:hypothetical protein, partial [Achromobacter dolens]
MLARVAGSLRGLIASDFQESKPQRSMTGSPWNSVAGAMWKTKTPVRRKPHGGFFSGFLFMVWRAPKDKTPQALACGVLSNKSLTMTYFHRRPSTIIGA